MMRRWSHGVLATALFAACGGTTIVDPSPGSGGEGATTSSDGGAGGATPECSDHADCGELERCVFDLGICALACDPNIPMFCAAEVCDICGTSGCPGCKNCVAVCLPNE